VVSQQKGWEDKKGRKEYQKKSKSFGGKLQRRKVERLRRKNSLGRGGLEVKFKKKRRGSVFLRGNEKGQGAVKKKEREKKKKGKSLKGVPKKEKNKPGEEDPQKKGPKFGSLGKKKKPLKAPKARVQNNCDPRQKGN